MKISILLLLSAQIIFTHSCFPKTSPPGSRWDASLGQLRGTSNNATPFQTEKEQLQMKQYLALQYEKVFSGMVEEDFKAKWNYEKDRENLTVKEIYENQMAERVANAQEEWEDLVQSINPDLADEEIEDIVNERLKLLNEMSEIFIKAKICPYQNQSCDLELTKLSVGSRFIESTDYNELAYLWTAWRNATGRKLRGIYSKYVNLGRIAAKQIGFNSTTQIWMTAFDSPTFQKDCEAIWDNVKPLYEELHGYIRYKLRERYPSKINLENPIPSHVLGNIRAETYEGLFPLLVPFPNASVDMNEELKKIFTSDLEGVKGMFEAANGFFMSMGLMNMSTAYGPKAMLVKPKGKRVVCHPTSFPVSRNDFRVRMCAEVNLKDFMTIHHELGHIQHYMAKGNEMYSERMKPNNPAFEEAIGDVLFLSAGTPQHMAKIGLLANHTGWTKESTVNYLMQVGLQKIAVLPYSYSMDAYRWKLFDGTIEPGNWTYYWVKMRSDIQGLIPPVVRDEGDLDIACKSHVVKDAQLISYFVSHILQFQLHKGLCKIAKEYPAKPLYQCDLYGSKEAGAQFRKLLETDNWQIFLEEIIGEKLNASAILEYFSPLYEYLKEYRAEKNYPIGWSKTAFEAFVRRG